MTLASGNVITLEVADCEKFLSNVAYTCQHLHPRPKLLIINYPHNPSSVTVEPEFFVEVVKLARRYGFMVISDAAYVDVAFDGYRPPSFLCRPGRGRRRRRIHHHEQGIQHGRLAQSVLPAIPRWCGPWGRSRPTTTTACSRRSKWPQSWPCGIPKRPSRRRASIYQHRRDVLVEGLHRLGWDITPPRAGMFVWAKIPTSGGSGWTRSVSP